MMLTLHRVRATATTATTADAINKSIKQLLRVNNIRSSQQQHYYTTLHNTRYNKRYVSSFYTPYTLHTQSFSSYPEHTILKMPALSPTMEKGNLVSWNKKVGDEMNPGDVMAEVETDKATVAFECVEDGLYVCVK